MAGLDLTDSRVANWIRAIQAEIDREVTNAHPLGTYRPKFIGKCASSDDVMTELADGRFAMIHLTWVENERMPDKFPGYAILETAEEVSQLIKAWAD